MSSSRRLIVILFLVLALPFNLQAQSPSTSPAVNQFVAETKKDFSQEPAVFEYIHESMRYENDGSGTREIRSRIRVQTQAGLSVGGQLVFGYNAADERIDVKSVRVLKMDGSIVTAGPEAVQDLSAPVTQQAPMYTDARQKHVTVPGLSVGDVVEYDVVVNARPIVPGQFWRIWEFDDKSIVLDERLDLDVPNSRAVKIKSPDGTEPTVSVEGDRRLYHWTTSNLKTPPPIDFFKNFQFDVTKLLEGPRPRPGPRVMFSTFQSWTEVSEWYAQLERERRVPTAEIHAKADQITRGRQGDEAKAKALYYWVSQNIRYVSLSFGVGRYQPHAAAEVLTNRYGDCKDKTTLLEAMLEAEGLHAQPVLVSARDEVDPEMPNPMQFDHAIAFLRTGNKEVWLDTTLGVGPFGYLLPQLRNSEALVISETPPAGLRKIPEDFPFSVEYRVGIEGTVDSQGVLNGNVELQTRGDLEVLIRAFDNYFAKDQLAKSADSVLRMSNRLLYGSVQYTDFKVANGTEISAPVKAQFHVSGKVLSVNPNSSPEQIAESLAWGMMVQLRALYPLPTKRTKPDSGDKPQQLPIELKGPRAYSLDLNLTFPDMPKSELPPAKEFHLTEEFAEFQSHDSWQGTTFHGTISLELRVPKIPAGASDEYETFANKIVEAFPAPAEPRKESKATTTPAKPQPTAGKYLAEPEVQEMYRRGDDESKRKNWANAIEAFGSAAKADPKYADAWRELGRAQMYAREYPEAESSFRKYLELAPNDHLAYLNMAWVLFTEKKFEEDRDLMLKRIAAAPDDGDALFRLGVAYLELQRPGDAVPVLERSIIQFPKYLAAHLALARAYLENHQSLIAQTALRKAVAVDNSDRTLNATAWLLAEHDLYLDIAEEWSQRSIDTVERELNNTTLSNVQSSTWTLIGKVGAYWDTLGWIKFQQGKTDEAEKYILAAWQVADHLTIGMHLGRIYEKLGRKDEAIEMYLAALNTVSPNGTVSEDGRETRKRLEEILGSAPQVDDRLKEYRKKKSPLRMVSIANPGGEQDIAQYTVIIDGSSKVVELSPTHSDDSLASLNDAVRAASMPQTFPDTTLKKLPRLSTLTCAASNQPCVFTLLPASAASRTISLD
jgi:tetratricopeptide (TPR) repeat protein